MTQNNGHTFIISIDGTGNDPTDANLTNVLKFHRALDRRLRHQVPLYYPGLGNKVEHGKIGQFFGFNFGWGAKRLRNRVYKDLAKLYRPGDQIFIFAFSRGAAVARMLTGLIADRGLNGQGVTIEMLGLWDTVAAFGIPLDVGWVPFQKMNLFKNLAVAPNVKKACHLVAVDEVLQPFRPTLIKTAGRADGVVIEEIWFPGGHIDVGGGANLNGLSDNTLKFMIERAREAGLGFNPAHLDQINPCVTDPIGHIALDLPKEPRQIYVVPAGRSASSNDGIALRPKIHHTVFDRMAALPDTYQPPNVLALNEVYDVIGPDRPDTGS